MSVSDLKKLKCDDQAIKYGCKVTDYDKFKKSNNKEVGWIIAAIFIYFVVGVGFGSVLTNQFNLSDETCYTSSEIIPITESYCEDMNLGFHIRTSFGLNRAIIECDKENIFIGDKYE